MRAVQRVEAYVSRLGSTGLMRLMAAKILKGARPICDKRAANSG